MRDNLPQTPPSVDHLTRFLLATDFDGTIAPIVDKPEQAVIDPIAERFLRRCSETPSVAVAVITGRDVDDARRRIGGVRAIIAGSHGLECIDATGRALWVCEKQSPTMPRSLLRDLLRSEVRVEQKKFSVAVHFRGRASDMRVHGGRVASWAEEENLDVIPGRQVIEVRLRGGGKRAALRAIASRLGVERFLYAGDDVTDFPALSFAAGHGRAIFVESDERLAPDIPGLWRVETIADLCYGFARELIEVIPAVVPSLVGGSAEIPASDIADAPPKAAQLSPTS